MALLDTGSVETVLPLDVAHAIGMQLGPAQGRIKWRGQRYTRQPAQVEIELKRGETTWRWQATVVFSPARIGYLLLGDRGCLQYLDAKFLGEERVAELETNASFPGEIHPSPAGP
jgi:hypothetical protein